MVSFDIDVVTDGVGDGRIDSAGDAETGVWAGASDSSGSSGATGVTGAGASDSSGDTDLFGEEAGLVGVNVLSFLNTCILPDGSPYS